MREYPAKWNYDDEAYYAMNEDTNNAFYRNYVELSEKHDKLIFDGRLGI